MSGRVYLIGAGPGDEGLITVKGLNCVKEANVIVYDRLIPQALLRYAPSTAEFIFVGKSPEKHTLTQEEINDLLIEQAEQGKIIARLKGGDPFVFGRGGEEVIALKEHNIPFEVVPGITSAVAAPMYAGIPVTHRGLSSSFAVITGHEDPDKAESSISWQDLALESGTLCFLMGVGNLSRIVDNLLAHGKDSETPIALVRWGTRPYQKTLTGTLSNIVEKAKSENFKSPAVIIIGEVVNLREQLAWFEKKPFFNKNILVTRARSQASELSYKISQLGGQPVEFPTIKIEKPDTYQPLDEAIKKLAEYNWLVFTSVNGVKHFFNRLENLDYDCRQLAGLKTCAIGSKTKESLEEKGIKADVVPQEYRAEALIDLMKEQVKSGDRVLIPRAKEAREVLPEALREQGLKVDVITAYETVKDTKDTEKVRKMLKQNELDAITFTSSSTVKNFVEVLELNVGLNEPGAVLANTHIACIGPITASTCQQYGIEVNSIANEYTIPGLVESLIDNLDENVEEEFK
ncbi:uroporphyrinogen-III C-methyltransferase [Natranaerobius thermophilus]|uniref:uroporphyrinogen-III C-methyltransferase n=1 Tax=Natranaerobius thermophilus (strain ATCC BAA-1301 / DSM 18059 / JW/NM-WN-LF) TaxID=457570 RepID=B2A1G8_NATTJ|nr:uroporphyrinogen-III C-methyltransferase [Natranaerobius thermophilus]ACB84708.1 uroporphyrinogen-III C-methyltransferase, uroporphyrinogen-III synthase [Natranaerobius thermophilus JW/NM-WN-LF]